MPMYIAGALENYLLLSPIYIAAEYLLYKHYKKHNQSASLGFIIGWQILTCLLLAIFSITGTAGAGNFIQFSLAELNLIPFIHGDARGMFLNALLFLPVGILLPTLFTSEHRFIRTAAAGALLSLLIELSQLFNFRATDIDDLLMNTLGTAAGYLLYKLIFHRFTFLQLNDGTQKGLNGGIKNIIFIFIIYFYIAEPIRSILYSILYR